MIEILAYLEVFGNVWKRTGNNKDLPTEIGYIMIEYWAWINDCKHIKLTGKYELSSIAESLLFLHKVHNFTPDLSNCGVW